jgi:hypothetical protein
MIVCEDLEDDIEELLRPVCGSYHSALFTVLQSREGLLLPIVRVPRELFIRHKLGTHHLLFLLGSLTLVRRSWEHRVLQQVEQILHEVAERSELQVARAARKCGTALRWTVPLQI